MPIFNNASAPPMADLNWSRQDTPMYPRMPAPYSRAPKQTAQQQPSKPQPSATSTFGRELDLNEDCVICTNKLNAVAEGDTSNKLEVARTKCQHAFHNYCINRMLTDGVNNNCPLCREKVTTVGLTVINLGTAAPKTPAQQPPLAKPGVQAKAAPSRDASAILGGLASGAWKLAKGVGNVTATVVGATLKALAPAPKTVQDVEAHSVEVYAKLKKANIDQQKMMKDQKEQMEMLIATVKSMAGNNPEKADEALTKISKVLAKFQTEFSTLTQKYSTELTIERLKLVEPTTTAA